MTQKNFVALSEIKQKIIHFKQEIGGLTQENAEDFRKRLQDIKDDMQLVLLESTDRQEERIQRREKINTQIAQENKEGPSKAKERYFQEHAKEALERLAKKGLRIDDEGNILLGKLKNPKKIANVIPVDFKPTPLRKGDHYLSVRQKLEHREQEIINELTSLLELAEEKSRNMYQYYTNPSELFEKLGLSIKKVDYAFFAKELNKTPLPRVGGDQDIVKKGPGEIPNFKKIGAFMKYVIENNILFRASNIVTDNNQWYQFYFYDRDVTVLISDEITGNCFRDATYVIKGMLPGLRNFKKEEFKKYQGKKIIFNDQWCKRLGSVFTENPDHWTNIGEEKDDQPEVTRTLLTDRIKCIELLKDNFTPETFNTSSYKAFARAYNAQQNNEFFLNETINGLVSLFGIGGKVTMEVIKDAIFESKKPKLQIPEDAYLYTKNQHIKNMLVAMSKCEEFDPETVLGSVNYDRWVKELTRKAYGAEFVDDVANKSPKEKKEKLEIYTGIKGFPLYARKLTSMLGGRVRSLDAVYQKMLWKKFIMHMDNKSTLQEYKDLQHEILTYETNWEDGKIKPNVNKSEHKGRKKVEQTVVSPGIQKSKENIQIQIKDILKDPLTIENFPLFKVKSAKIVGETPTYRIMKAYNSTIKLRLPKFTVMQQKFAIGDKVDVFAVRKLRKENAITVNYEREPGYHKVVQFRMAHDDALVETFTSGKKYDAVVNNIQGKYVYLSLTKRYSGRIERENGVEYKIGDVVKVVFDKMDTDDQNKKIIKIH